MMASMGPSFSPHPAGMQQHPGVPQGHPGLAPGMAHNPSQPGAQPGAMPQHLAHMGVSGPGPQVNPAAMMGGVPPGAGPNAHAMQHLNPQQQAQLFQQQQQLNSMAFANNPALQAQLQQQRYHQIQQQQQQQQRILLAQQHGMYPGSIPMGMPMNQNQFAAMRRMAPQHAGDPRAQALIAQHLAMQQQQQHQAAANNQLMQGQNPNLQGQLNPSQLQAHMAAIQAQTQQAQAAAAAAQQQPQPQPQVQQPQPQPGQPQPQTPQQQGQPGPSPSPAQQNQGPNPAQAAQQIAPHQGPGHQPQAQQPHPPPNQMMVQQAQQQANIANSIMQQRNREGMKGQCLSKLMQFGEDLSGFPGSKGKDDLSYWNEFVHRFFSPKGLFRHAVHIIDGEDGSDKQYEIPFAALARYFHTHFDSGVKNMQLVMDKGTTDKPLPGDCHFIENNKASLIFWFEGGTHVVATGTVRAQFDAEQKIELFEFLCTGHEEYISRRLVIQAAKPQHNWVKEWHKVNTQDTKQSPEMSKKGKAKQLKSPQQPPPDMDLPQSAVKQSVGLTEAVNQFLEIVEIMGQMTPLFNFYHNHPGLAPYAALDQYVSGINTGPPNMNGQPMPPGGPRTPGYGQFPMGTSPHAAHLQLPGSPHVGSPAPGSMQAPSMHPSQSQQGTSSSGPSANTSPSGTKRRRPSGVKEEDMSTPASAPTPSGGAQVNGIQNKTKPPTPRMQKKQKINPA